MLWQSCAGGCSRARRRQQHRRRWPRL